MDKLSNQDWHEILASRSASYTLLARLYRQETTAEMLQTLVASAAANENPPASQGDRVFNTYLRALAHTDLAATVSDLAAEFAALFLNASRQPVHPFESVYTSPEHLLMQEARDQVLAEYHRAGLERIHAFHEPEDHIALEFEFMAHLCRKTLDAQAASEQTTMRALLEWQKQFFDAHLAVWVPRFSHDLERLARSDFYRAIALLTAELIEAERETIPALLAALATP